MAEPVSRPNVHTNEEPEKVSPNALKYKRKIIFNPMLTNQIITILLLHSECTH